MIHQLREPVAVALQGEFFAQVRTRRQSLVEKQERGQTSHEQDWIQRIERILQSDAEIPSERLMLYFTRLACFSSIDALRFAESLQSRLTGDARQLALMAELELRMQVYEDLTEQPQAIIASGLGGEGELIRLNGVAMKRDFTRWESYQRDLLHRELDYICGANGGYIESELWGEEYYGFRLMLPYHLDIAEMIEQYLNVCNEYGDFLHPDCHVTNMLLLEHEHIQELVKLRRHQSISQHTDIDSLLNSILGNPDEAIDADRNIRPPHTEADDDSDNKHLD